MTDKELISKLQSLKQIKPRENWAVLAKSQIFYDNVIIDNKVVGKLTYRQVLSNISGLFFQKKFAYAFAALFVVFAGAFGFMKFSDPQPSADLVMVKSNVEILKVKSQNLAEAARNKSGNISLAVNEVKDAAKELTQQIQKDPELVKTIALDVNNNKTYLDINGGNEGSDLKETTDVLYKTIDDQMILDLQKTTLTEDQKNKLSDINNLYIQGKYAAALEGILMINVASNK